MLAPSSEITVLPQVSDRYASLLSKLGIDSVGELLTYFPRYHKDTTELSGIDQIAAEENYTIQAQIENLTNVRIRGGRSMQKATLIDLEGNTIPATWWNQPYLIRALSESKEYLFSGKGKEYKGKLSFFPNGFEEVREGKQQTHLGRISPQYRLTKGISPKWLRNRIKFLLDNIDLMEELAAEFSNIAELAAEQLGGEVDFIESLKQIHFPDSEEEYNESKKVLGLIELTNLQLKLFEKFLIRKAFHAPKIEIDKQVIQKFRSEIGFDLTEDQQVAVANILVELTKGQPMNRLLQGDVGTGKTIVAIISALAMKSAGYQTVVLVPTTVLANQHFENFSKLLSGQDVSINLITGDTGTFEPADIIIGTSAILARKDSVISKPGLIIVDEQHRFGVAQREELLAPFKFSKDAYPHFLDMTATPIPRTMAMTLFGEVEVSNIITKPAGRKPIKTFVVPEKKREDSYKWILDQIEDTGQQAFWICPLVEESEKLEAASAKKVHQQLEEIYPSLKIGLLHGKLKAKEKQQVMDDFAAGVYHILVSTSVIEVGIDVANASMMVIEGAERFGLAQLHQIRGRVGRGDAQSFCFVFTSDEANEEVLERLNFFADNANGLDIAQYDLERRGPGEVYGTRQSGIPDLKLANLLDLEQLTQSRVIAESLYKEGVKKIPLF